jgi:hypothetical protein
MIFEEDATPIPPSDLWYWPETVRVRMVSCGVALTGDAGSMTAASSGRRGSLSFIAVMLFGHSI